MINSKNNINFIRLKYLTVLILFAPVVSLFSQGFDWQYSSRMPSKHPDFYIGVVANSSFVYNITDFDFTTDYIKCTKFSNDTGVNLTGGIKSEYWLNANHAVNASITYKNNSNVFSETQSWLAISNKEYYKKYKYIYESDFSYISMEINHKYRILLSHFNISYGLATQFIINKNNVFWEETVSPDNLTFRDGLKKHKIAYGNIASINSFGILFNTKFGYDFSITNGRYANIALDFDYTPVSILKNEDWQQLTVGLELTIYQGIIFDN